MNSSLGLGNQLHLTRTAPLLANIFFKFHHKEIVSSLFFWLDQKSDRQAISPGHL
jgi:hypothetical protein